MVIKRKCPFDDGHFKTIAKSSSLILDILYSNASILQPFFSMVTSLKINILRGYYE